MTFSAKLKLLIAGATPMPWRPVITKNTVHVAGPDCQVYSPLIDPGDMHISKVRWEFDAKFVTEMRNHAADIVALVEAAQTVSTGHEEGSEPFEPEYQRLVAALTTLNKDT